MKGFVSFLLSVVLFVTVLFLTCTIVVRVVVSSDNLSNLLAQMIEVDEDKEGFAEALFADVEGKEEFIEYIDSNKLKKVLGEYFHQFVMYKIGIKEKIDSTAIIDFIKECSTKYNKDHEDKITQEDIDEMIDKINAEIAKEEIEDEVSKVAKILFSKTLLFVSILAIVIVFGLLDLLNKNINTPLLISGINIFIVGLIILGLNGLLISVEVEDRGAEIIKNALLSPVKMISIIELGIGIVLIVISRIVKDNTQELNDNPNQKEVTNF